MTERECADLHKQRQSKPGPYEPSKAHPSRELEWRTIRSRTALRNAVMSPPKAEGCTGSSTRTTHRCVDAIVRMRSFSSSAGRIDVERLTCFVQAYQTVTPSSWGSCGPGLMLMLSP